jgi:hypothetical protein
LHRGLKAARQELHNLQVLQLQPGKSPERLEMLHKFERSARSPSFRFLSRTTRGLSRRPGWAAIPGRSYAVSRKGLPRQGSAMRQNSSFNRVDI